MKILQPRLSSLRRLAAASLLAAAALAATCLPTAAAYVLNDEEALLAEYLVNDPGQQRPAMQFDPILARLARERAEDMAARNYFAHVNPDGWAANALVLDAGYILPSAWGTELTNNYIESIAAGFSGVADTWADWMDSPPHRAHLLALNAFYQTETSYGVGYAYSATSTYHHYWVVLTAPPNVPEANAALFVAQSTPPAMTTGQTYSVSVSLLNTGSQTWTQDGGYRLASLAPAGLWNVPSVPVPADVTPGSTVTFSFNVTAPPEPGYDAFQWRMEQAGSAPFGEASGNRVIPVSLPAPPPSSSSASSGSWGNYSAPSGSSKKAKKVKAKKAKKKKK